MKKESKKWFLVGLCLITAFIIWTVLLRFIDVKAIGPNGSKVGFSSINGPIRDLIGSNMTLYIITDWLGLVPVAFAFDFAVLGLFEWIKRKHFLKVDKSILYLGCFYTVVMGVYILFEYLVINYRPVLINGYLEASYPSSTTMLVACVMPTAIMQFNLRIKTPSIRRLTSVLITIFIAFMVLGRIISGVHWITDIIGGALISVGLVSIYYATLKLF